MSRLGRKPNARLVVGLLAALSAGGLGAFFIGPGRDRPSPPAEDEAIAQEVLRLRRENRALELELVLASEVRPYLILDMPGRTITLKSQGAPLRGFQALETSVRDRRHRGFLGRRPSTVGTAWAGGILLPRRNKNRVVILSDSVAAPDPSGTMSYIPPTPEEATPGPHTFRIRFDGGLSLLVRSGADFSAPASDTAQGERGDPVAAAGPNLFQRVLLWFRLKPWRRDPLRLEVVLSSDEAGSLYRAFSDGTPILVVGPLDRNDPSGDEGAP
ncbi:MAG: hypothetical protein E4G90_09235 [Gemmatimonadales bacterium]|nr:MAG: hypothetical protein E4G90_09235 [Gemmatimonadales bacterium]